MKTIFILVFIYFFMINNSYSFKLDFLIKIFNENDKEILLTGFDRSYGVGVKNDLVFIPDFFSGLIYEFDLKNNKSKILKSYKNKLRNLSLFEKISKFRLKRSIFKPHDIFFDNELNMYISEMGDNKMNKNGKILVFDNNLNFNADINFIVSKNYELQNPIMIYKKNDKYYITENNRNIILRFNKNYEFLDWIGEESELDNNFININLLNPHAIKIGPRNEIYIVDTGNHRILRFSNEGKYEGWIGKKSNGSINESWQKDGVSKKGSELGAFDSPCDLIVLDGYIYVSDTHNNRIMKINLDGKGIGLLSFDEITRQYIWSKEIKNKIDLKHPFGIKIEKNRIFIADRGNNRIKILYSKNLF